VALSVRKKAYAHKNKFLFLPGRYPAFFSVEPGLSSPANAVISKAGTVTSFL